MSNRLIHASSPYLRQHADNPVDWYPWGEDAFEKAKRENKPIFLSIGYSTCHWCHVMARECFADAEVARLLNESFVSVKVDREERPDIDSIYMSVCQAFTGSGGWPTSVFMTWEQKPFFAGTYFPKQSRHGRIGFMELLLMIREKWESDRLSLQLQAEHIVQRLRERVMQPGDAELQLADIAVRLYQRDYDATNGGFGAAPKFPAPHNLLFLMEYAERMEDRQCMEMAEHTLMQMYRGGLFDHIGYGFSRYSTDDKYLVPHFEKMLYDNAMLILAYCKAYSVTKKTIYRDIAGKTADYILREMTSPAGGFYSAQDADSDGEEGKYYVFTPREISTVLGEDKGRAFCALFDITESGNFEGSSIPNLLQGGAAETISEETMRKLREYRKQRCRLHLDNKILTSWNGLMIAAMCRLYSVTGEQSYLESAKFAERFVREHLLEGDTLFVSICDGVRSGNGFLDDYAAYIFALLALHGATLEESYFERAQWMCCKVLLDFKDLKHGGFFLYGHDGEHLITRPKEVYDGAMPSGNSLMAWNLVRLYHLNDGKSWGKESEQQLRFLAGEAERYPSGYAMFLLALLQWEFPPAQITVVPKQGTSTAEIVAQTGMDAVVTIRDGDGSYPMTNDQTTYYVCADGACFPPVNRLKSEAEIL